MTVKKQPKKDKEQPEEEQLLVNGNTAVNLKLREFDKAIVTAEHMVTELKMKKVVFLYEQSMAAAKIQSEENKLRQTLKK